ncbi:MAG: hypothetical protein JJ858_11900 [Rhizobiaceae bacterium]|nr:hypothetical protein [Rhizobiaceae bacterium]
MVVGINDRDEFGGWENLTSSWLWQCFKSNTLNDAITLVSIANLKPNLIVLDNVYNNQNELIVDLQKLENNALAGVPVIISDDQINPDWLLEFSREIRTIVPGFKASDLRKSAEEII